MVPEVPPDKRLVFRPWITKNGRRIYARQYGLRAFPILIDR